MSTSQIRKKIRSLNKEDKTGGSNRQRACGEEKGGGGPNELGRVEGRVITCHVMFAQKMVMMMKSICTVF